MRRSDPSANKPSSWSIYHDATGELQLTGGILHSMVSEFMYFTNPISLGWGCTVLWGPQSPPVWNTFLLSCISQPDKGCGAILVHTVVACISSATSRPGGHSPLGWAGRHTTGLGDNSGFQPFVRLLQAAYSTGGGEGLCYCSYLHSPASPSPPGSISDTDFTNSGDKPGFVCRISFPFIILLSWLMNTTDLWGEMLPTHPGPVLSSWGVPRSCKKPNQACLWAWIRSATEGQRWIKIAFGNIVVNGITWAIYFYGFWGMSSTEYQERILHLNI